MTDQDALFPPIADDEFPVPAPLDSHGPARIVAMSNQKGGVGKTTTTINLAAALAAYGRRILIVDFDPQGAAIVPTSIENLDLVPANIDLSAAEIVLINEVAREQALSRVLRPVVDDYDLVIIDCQPSLGLLTVNALTAAHGVLIPLEAEYFAMRGVALLTEQIERVQERLNPRLQTDGVLLTMVDTRTLHSREVANSVRQGFGDTVYTTYISRTVKFPDATIAAAPITLYAPSHPGSVAYRQLAREIVARGQCA